MKRLTAASAVALIIAAGSGCGEVTSETLKFISIPDTVETTFDFFDALRPHIYRPCKEWPDGHRGSSGRARYSQRCMAAVCGQHGCYGADAGKCLVVRSGSAGDTPEGDLRLNPATNRNFLFLRGSIAKGHEPPVANITSNLKAYSLTDVVNPTEAAFRNASKKAFSILFPSDYNYFEILDRIVQKKPFEAIGPEVRGTIAAMKASGLG